MPGGGCVCWWRVSSALGGLAWAVRLGREGEAGDWSLVQGQAWTA